MASATTLLKSAFLPNKSEWFARTTAPKPNTASFSLNVRALAFSDELVKTAKTMASPGRGLLAMDESNATCGKRLASIGVDNTEENRQAYRTLLNFNPYDGHQHSYAIELYFDPALENQVLKAWNVLARRQITTHLISISSRPHITLLVVSSSNPNAPPPPPPSAALHSALRTFATRTEPFPICLTSVATSGSNSLFLLPTPTMPLLQMHSRLCEALGKEGVEVGDDYKPDAWLPCCSLAEEVSKSSMTEAFGVLKDMKLPVTGYVMDVGVVEFGNAGSGPVKELFSIQLGGSGAGAGLQDA